MEESIQEVEEEILEEGELELLNSIRNGDDEEEEL